MYRVRADLKAVFPSPPTKVWANATALVKLTATKCLARGMQTSWLGIRSA
jgi:hypothetical protein